MAAQMNTSCLCGLPGCNIFPRTVFAPGKLNGGVGLTIEDAEALQKRATIIEKICTLNQQLSPPLHISLPEARPQPLDHPVMRTELMTSRMPLHKEQLKREAAQTGPERTNDTWINATSGVPQDKLCPWCGDIFKWGGSRKRHIKLVHQGDRNCPHCEIPYCSQRILNQHLALREKRGRCYLTLEEMEKHSDVSILEFSGTNEKDTSESD